MIKHYYNRNSYGAAVVESLDDVVDLLVEVMGLGDVSQKFQNQKDKCMTITYTKFNSLDEETFFDIRLMSGDSSGIACNDIEIEGNEQ